MGETVNDWVRLTGGVMGETVTDWLKTYRWGDG